MFENNQDIIIGKENNKNQETRQEKIKNLFSKFQRQSNAIYCTLIDCEGFILSSELAENIKDSVFKNSVVFYNALQFLKRNRKQLLNFSDEIGKISVYFDDYDLNSMPTGLTILIKQVISGVCFISVLPAWLDLTYIEINFELLVEKVAELLIL